MNARSLFSLPLILLAAHIVDSQPALAKSTLQAFSEATNNNYLMQQKLPKNTTEEQRLAVTRHIFADANKKFQQDMNRKNAEVIAWQIKFARNLSDQLKLLAQGKKQGGPTKGSAQEADETGDDREAPEKEQATFQGGAAGADKVEFGKPAGKKATRPPKKKKAKIIDGVMQD